MRVYVESNFLLEIVLKQEQATHASELKRLALAGIVELAVPAFALAEPYWKLRRDTEKRKAYLGELTDEVAQLRRSRERSHLAETAERLIEQLREFDLELANELDDLVRELSASCVILGMSAEVIRGALDISVQTTLAMQDAVVLASVMEDLTARSVPDHCAFVSRDRKAFQDPAIVAQLIDLRCVYIPKFDDAVRFVQARLSN